MTSASFFKFLFQVAFFVREDSDFAFAGLRFGLVPTLQCRVTQSTGILIYAVAGRRVSSLTICPCIICIRFCVFT